MSDEEENDELDEISDLPDLSDSVKRSSCSFQVSGWENDNEGIEEENNPHESPDKELLWAAENGDMDLVKNIVEKDNSFVHVKDKDGYSPLHRACYNDHTDIVKYLLQKGAKHDAETCDNWQPLHSACKWNNFKCAALLISHGADVNAQSKGGVTPLNLACGHPNSRPLMKLILSNPEIRLEHRDTQGDDAYTIARRSGTNSFLFEASEPCFL